jgi:hypothetical protein
LQDDVGKWTLFIIDGFVISPKLHQLHLLRLFYHPPLAGGVRGGEAAPSGFLVAVGGESANSNQKLGCGAQPHDGASALPILQRSCKIT